MGAARNDVEEAVSSVQKQKLPFLTLRDKEIQTCLV